MLNFLRKQSIIGIDISDYSIEVLQLSKNRVVLAYNRTVLEEGVVQDGKIVKKETLVKKLKELLSGITSRPSKAILSLPESKIFIHYFELPRNLQGEALREKILEESSKIIPLNQGRIYWDYIAISKKESQHVVYIGTLKEIVDEYIEVMRSVGIETVAVDAESLSLSRALVGQPFLKSSSMIIDIGARTTNASIFNPAKLLALSITIPIAGNNFTRDIAEKLKIKSNEAEELKRKFGFDDKKQENKILSILQASFQPIIKELKEAISHYENNRGEKIEEIILAGGSALLPKVDEYLTVNLERKVKIGNPFERIKDGQLMDKKYSPILFANVVGLALRSTGDISKGINLLQQMPSAKKVAWKRPQLSTLPARHASQGEAGRQVSGLLQNIRKSRVFAISFIVIAFVILGFVIYQNFFMPSIQEAQTGEYPKEPPASNPEGEQVPYGASGIKVESPKAEELVPTPKENKFPTGQVSPESELLPEEEGNTTEVKETIVIQDTPTGWLNVRKGPGASYEQVARVNSGETYTLLEEKDKWYKIKIDEETQGWVTSQYAIKQ